MKFFIPLFLFLIININAQIEEIDLPKGENEFKIWNTAPIISLYVLKNNDLFFEKEQILYCNLAKKVSYYRYKLPADLQLSLKIFLYVDKNTNYHFIDKIKTELASIGIYYITYKTCTINDKDFLKGFVFRNYSSFFNYKIIERKHSKAQREMNIAFNKGVPPPPLPPPAHWSENFYKNLYSDNNQLIKETLNSKRYIVLTITNKGLVLDGKKLKSKKIKDILAVKEAIIFKFSSDLKYENYIRIHQLILPLRKRNQFFFEISNEIDEIHKQNKINVCNF